MYGFLAGSFALIVLEVLVANKSAYSAVGGVFGVLASAADHFFDPNVPAIGKRPATPNGGLQITGGLLPDNGATSSSVTLPSSSTMLV